MRSRIYSGSRSGESRNGPGAVVVCTALLLAGLIAVLLRPGNAAGQTSQRLSVQGSVIYTDVYGDEFYAFDGGMGFELQLRYTPSALSFGGGIQYTIHGDSEARADGHEDDVDLLGVFFEPRYVIGAGSESYAPYLSARLAVTRYHLRNDFSDGGFFEFTSTGATLNVGGGVLVRLAERVNLDVGATAGYSRFAATDGTSDTNPSFPIAVRAGSNLVARLGVAVGLGR